VTFAVGIFDLFTYTIPGSLYLAFFGYLAARVHWIDPGAVARTPTVLLLIVLVLLSYLVGFLAYPLGSVANRLVPRRRKRNTLQEFLRRVPAARGRDYVNADLSVLLAALQLHDKEVAIEVTRLRATGLMLRNSAPPLAFGFVAAIVELALWRHPVLAAGLTVLFGFGCFALIVQGRRFGHWAGLKTLELSFWLPDIDEQCRVAKS
jgi:hypothetical protein